MRNTKWIVLLFALIKFSIPFLFIYSAFDLQRDEYLYLADGRHLAWGYIEMPPIMALMGRLTMDLGGSIFLVHVWPALLGALTMVIIGQIVEKMGGGVYATVIACLGFLVAGFLRMHILFQPNILDVFWWTLSSYFIVLLINTQNARYLYLIGICFGLGMLSKYTMSFYILAFWVSLLLTNERKWLTNKHFYLSMLVAFLVFLPNLLWEINHQFPVAHHMRLLQRQQLQYLSRFSFLVDQILDTLPSFFVWFTGLLYLFLSKEGHRYRIFAWMFLVILTVLLIFNGKSYYAMSIYPTLFAVGGFALEKGLIPKRRIFAWSLCGVMLLLLIPIFPIAVPYTSPSRLDKIYKTFGVEKLGVLMWEDRKNHPLPMDFGDMLGWKEMGLKVADAWNNLDSNEKKNTVIFCDNYGQAGAVNFYGAAYRLPEAYSDNASFLYWIKPDIHIDNLILVTDDKQEMEHPFIKDFRSAKVWDSVTNEYAREQGSLIIVLKGANDSFNEMFRRKIAKDKANLLH